MKFNINEAPPTELYIHQELKYTQEQIRMSTFYMAATIATAAITFPLQMIVLPKIFHGWLWQTWYLLPWPAATATALLFLYLGDHCFAKKILRLKKIHNSLNTIPASKAEEVIRICETNPDCEKYRLAVVQQGREILQVEFQHMRLKAQSIAEKEAQKRLYGPDTLQKAAQLSKAHP